ncbi:MAG: type II toxin-antitoxin system HicB family antitoxin [Candidatus Omnitrophica bacterium]|nr:type II toxin-antitoxin system HicB family antitoxin [Candidatus Omnitrophota bacterium]
MIYYFKVRKAEKGYWGNFPDLEGSTTQGETLEEILSNAREVLDLVLETDFDYKCEIPLPKKYHGKSYHPVACDPTIGFPVLLRKTRLARKWTQKDMAKKLGVSLSAYQRLETPGKANPTIKTLDRLNELMHLPLSFLFDQAA